MHERPRIWSQLVSATGRDVLYDLVVYVLWSDGRASPDEVSGARAAATALGMDLTEFPGLIHRSGVMFESLPLHELGPTERPLGYALAAWMAMADGVLAVSENMVLRRLAGVLRIEQPLADFIEAAAARQARPGANADEHRARLEDLLEGVAARMVGLSAGVEPLRVTGDREA